MFIENSDQEYFKKKERIITVSVQSKDLLDKHAVEISAMGQETWLESLQRLVSAVLLF